MTTELTDEIRENIRRQLTAKPAPKIRTRHIIAGGTRKRHNKGLKWPFHSDALGVNPDQIDEAEAHLRKAGVPIEFDRETGAAIITGPDQYKKVAAASGLRTGAEGFEIKGRPTGRQEEKNREVRREMIDTLASGEYPDNWDSGPIEMEDWDEG